MMKKIFTLIAFLAVTIGAMAQSQQVFEWKNGRVTIRSTSEIDSLTFSIPDEAVVIITGTPSSITRNSMTASYSLSSVLDIANASTVTEQGVCYSSVNEAPTIVDSKIKYGTFYIGDWSVTLTLLQYNTKYNYRPYLKIANTVFYGPVKSFTTDSIPEYAVDLGLPYGTLWADRNVGADSPEAYGDYFAWGETSTKSTYNWSTYKWCKGDYDTMTKYCTDSSYGTVDNKTVLDLEDDAAYVNMGTEWRMPTRAELDVLYGHCTWTWTSQNGIDGYRVTGPNGNSIFLPVAGCWTTRGLGGAGTYGYYSSSSLHKGEPIISWALFFDSEERLPNNAYTRCFGLPVRAVAR